MPPSRGFEYVFSVLSLRWGRVKARSTCSACGQPLPLSCLGSTTSCPYCFAEQSIPTDLWTKVLRQLDEVAERPGWSDEGTVTSGARRLTYEIDHAPPSCEKCDQPFALDSLEPGVSRNFACVACGDPASTEPVPGWARRGVSSARQVVTVNPKPELGGDVTLTADPGAPKLIAMACPRCGGGLEITTQSQRLFACRFCTAEVYLPDEIWRRLHPIRRVEAIYVGFEGPSLRQLRESQQAARDAQARERRAAHERAEAQREADRALARSRRAAASKQRAWIAATIHASFFAAAIVLGLSNVPLPHAMLVALIVTLVVTTLVVCGFVSKPIQVVTERDSDWMIFATWF